MRLSERHGLPSRTGEEAVVPAYPVSFAQEQLWFLDRLTPGETVYNILLVWRLNGPLRAGVLQRCLELVVARHGALRTTIRHSGDGLHQIVAPAAEVPLPVTDLTELPGTEREERLRSGIDALRGAAYDLETGPLHRFSLFRLGQEEYVFCQGFHHLVTDGWSTSLINAELSTAYRSLCAGAEPVFDEVQLDYTAFAASQRERLRGDALAGELEFWQRKLAGVPVLELPADRPRPVRGHRGETLLTDLPADLRGLVRALADDHGASPFMVLTAALALVLSRYTGLDDVPIGVPMLGRPEPELESVVGMFVNMAVLRSDLSGDPAFSELIDRVADGSMELYEHQEAPFNQVVDAVRPAREAGRNPLFQVSMQMLGGNTSGANLALPGVAAELVPLAAEGSRFDIGITLVDSGSGLRAAVEYASGMFDSWRIEAILAHLVTVVRAAAADPGLPLSRIPLTDGAEARRLLAAGRGETTGWSGQPVHLAVSRAAGRRPGAVAVVSGGLELTYGALDRRADALARRLRARGLRRGETVAVVADLGVDACVAALGVLKAGGAFALLGVEEAADRLASVTGDTAAPMVLTPSDVATRLPEPYGRRAVTCDADGTEEETGADGPPGETATAGSRACVVRDPAGGASDVVMSHRALSFGCEGHGRLLGLAPGHRLLVLPPVSSGTAHTDLWAGLASGATVIVATAEESAHPERLAALLRDQRVTHAHLPPALRALLDPGTFPDLTHVQGGDRVLPPEAAGRWADAGRRFTTLYGPPAAPVSCVADGPAGAGGPEPVAAARPHANRQLYVVDRSLNLVPRGVVGELLVGGEPGSLADGCLDRPGAAEDRFVADPFHPGRLAFRSGEAARWTPDLRLELLGPAEERIERRGLRIDPGRIEALLSSHPDVAGAVVLADEDDGERRLIGCVTPAAGRRPVPEELRARLADVLPATMIPAAWAVLPRMPVRPDWRIDRAAVAALAAAGGGSTDHGRPRTPTEKAVADIFGEVLSSPELGAEDSFFDAGGNSLQAMRAVSRINKRFGVKLGIRALYGNVTVRAAAALVDEKIGEGPA